MSTTGFYDRITALVHSGQWRLLPLVVLVPFAVFYLGCFVVQVARYVLADRQVRPLLRRAWRIKATWKRAARRVGLVQTERGRPKFWSSTPHTTVIERELLPSVKIKAQWWGVIVDAFTLGRIGLKQFQDVAAHLADVWTVPHVRVEQLRPGVVRLRAIVCDPLTQQTQWTDKGRSRTTPTRRAAAPQPAADAGTWHAGVDADGEPVTIRSSGVSGVVIAGLAGYGKTSFLNARIAELAPSPAVQFVLIDGKGGPDYDGLFARAWLSAKDDPVRVRDHLSTVHKLMTARQHAIRDVLGVKNMWQIGPTLEWPFLLVVIDEAHTFLNETKGADAESKRLDALARESARLVEELIRKGRNVGIQVILATQKATGDAIPTRIRDNCQVAVSFAQRTSEAATAILGSDITAWPDEHPRRLQDPAYVGVASMVAAGRPGFTLVRTRHISDEAADRIAADTAHLVADPLQLLCSAGREGGGSFDQEHSAVLPHSIHPMAGEDHL